ncbi:MAG: ribbon-helix-helix protein, CopG family [Eubacteriales bacterium]|nr:ribbon-helix-helix protein, CopG family [Eubacteriales bacterium]
MSKTQKLTITLGNLDLAKIDLLVDMQSYSSRSDFIRDAVRNHLKSFEPDIKAFVEAEHAFKEKEVAEIGGIGVIALKRDDLLYLKEKQMKADIMVVGLLAVSKDIELELAKETIRNIKVYGSIRGGKKVVALLEEMRKK